MANVKISELAALTTPATDDMLVIVDASEALDADKTKYITVSNLRAGPTFLTTPLTSTAWDGDSFSTTGKTLIDLSSVFGAPAGIKAVLLEVRARDSASSSSNCYIGFSQNDTANSWALVNKPYDQANDTYRHVQGIVPCDANGDIYYQTFATGSGTLDVFIYIWGYWL